MTQLGSFVPASRQKTFEAEVLGIAHKEESTYFKTTDVDSFLQRERTSGFGLQQGLVYIAVDPSTHIKSCMGFVAFGYNEAGQVVILGLSQVKAGRHHHTYLPSLTRLFTKKVLEVTAHIKKRTVIPIVECNNNDHVAEIITEAIRICSTRYKNVRYSMPFVHANFDKNITNNIGVWTRSENKFQGLKEIQTLVFQGRIILAENLASVSRSQTDEPRASGISQWAASAQAITDGIIHEQIDEFKAQLLRMHDVEKPSGNGKFTNIVTGKTAFGDNDDIAVAFIFGIYWSTIITQKQLYAQQPPSNITGKGKRIEPPQQQPQRKSLIQSSSSSRNPNRTLSNKPKTHLYTRPQRA